MMEFDISGRLVNALESGCKQVVTQKFISSVRWCFWQKELEMDHMHRQAMNFIIIFAHLFVQIRLRKKLQTPVENIMKIHGIYNEKSPSDLKIHIPWREIERNLCCCTDMAPGPMDYRHRPTEPCHNLASMGQYMGVEPKIVGVSPQIIPFLIGFSIIFTIHFGGPPLFLETPI